MRDGFLGRFSGVLHFFGASSCGVSRALYCLGGCACGGFTDSRSGFAGSFGGFACGSRGRINCCASRMGSSTSGFLSFFNRRGSGIFGFLTGGQRQYGEKSDE